jgi:hypothetical protein
VNEKETIQFLALIKLAYPSSFKDIDKTTKLATIAMWKKTFQHTPYPIMEMALDKHRRTSPFEPKVADIMGRLKGLYYDALEGALLGQDKEKCMAVMRYTHPFVTGEMENGIRDMPTLNEHQAPLQIGGVV